jgi:CBS domain containing-hemolysin-like protein
MSCQPHKRSAAPSLRALLALWLLATSPGPAAAQHLSGAIVDTIADYVAIFALIFVPIVLIALFWMVHVLPEKIAHKRGHPQADAIHTLCMLSLVFGGLLWPLAWLWAYSKPVLHKMAYGTDKVLHHADDAVEHKPGELLEGTTAEHGIRADVARLRHDVASLDEERPSVETVVRLRMELESLEERLATTGESSKEL